MQRVNRERRGASGEWIRVARAGVFQLELSLLDLHYDKDMNPCAPGRNEHGRPMPNIFRNGICSTLVGKRGVALFWIWVAIFVGLTVHAQNLVPGMVDACRVFQAPSGVLYFTATQQRDGRVLAAGADSRKKLVVHRFYSNGELDASFQLDPLIDGNLATLIAQPDGTILLAGLFTYPSQAVLVKLTSSGALFADFQPPTGDSVVRFVSLTPSGRILVGGPFQKISGVTRRNLALLDRFGALENSFDPGVGISGSVTNTTEVRCVHCLDEHSFLVGGRFLKYQNQWVPSLVKLQENGAIDPSFVPNLVSSFSVEVNRVNAIGRQSDGRLILDGTFAIENQRQARVIRTSVDGTLDPGFGPSVLDDSELSFSLMLIDPQDRILLGGDAGFRRLKADGTGDEAFFDERGNGTIYTVRSFAGVAEDCVFVASGDGRLRAHFAESAAQNDSPPALVYARQDLMSAIEGISFSEQPVVLGFPKPSLQWTLNHVPLSGQTNALFRLGWLSRSNMGILGLVASNRLGVLTQMVATLSGTLRDRSVGMVDHGFEFRSLPISEVQVLRADQDGDILVGGIRIPGVGKPLVELVRWKEEGKLDPSFQLVLPGQPVQFYDLERASKSEWVLSASVAISNTETQHMVYWLSSSGEVQRTVRLEGGPAYRFYPESSGSLLMVGDFTAVDGEPRGRIARFLPDGLLKQDLSDLVGPDGTVRAVVEDGSGGIWIGGDFHSVGGKARSGLAKLTPNGDLDSSFDPAAGFDGPVLDLWMPTSNTVWVGGSFKKFRNVTTGGMVRLSLQGDVLPGLRMGNVSCFAQDSSGQVWVGGVGARRLNPDGTDETVDVLPKLAQGAAFNRIAISTSGRVYAGGALVDTEPRTPWKSSLAVLLAKDEIGRELPRFVAEPVQDYSDPQNLTMAAAVSGHQLLYSWFAGTNLYWRSIDGAYVPVFGLTQLMLPVRLVVSNPIGSITSAPIALSTNVVRRLQLAGPKSQTLLFKGDPLVLYLRLPTLSLPENARLQWYKGKQLLDSTTGVFYRGAATEADAGCYTCSIQNRFEAYEVFTIVDVVEPAPWGDVLDFPNQKYRAGSLDGWESKEEPGNPPSKVVSSTPLGLGESRWFETVFQGQGILHFRWRLLTTSRSNTFTVTLNGVQRLSLNGPTDWTESQLSVGLGPQVFRWTFTKNENSADGVDVAQVDWVDFEQVGQAAPIVRVHPQPVTVDEGSFFTLAGVAEGPPPQIYQWYQNDVPLEGEQAPVLRRAGTLDAAGDYFVKIEGPGGTVSTATARATVIPNSPILTLIPSDQPGVFRLSVLAKPDIEMVLEASSDLLNWTTIDKLPAGQSTREKLITELDPMRILFFRLKVP